MMQRQRPSSGNGISARCTYDRGRPPWKPQYSPSYCRDRPPQYSPSYCRDRPNFIVQVKSNSLYRRAKKEEIERLISQLTYKPSSCKVSENGPVLGFLHYEQWVEALESMVQLWEMRLGKGHLLTPWLIPYVGTPSDRDELRDRLKGVFLRKLEGLLEDDVVKKWEAKAERVSNEARDIGASLKKTNRLKDAHELIERKDGLVKEGHLIDKRVEEFRNGIQSMVDYLEGKGEEDGSGFGLNVRVFKFGREFDWERIHLLMVRECRRLDDGLPIFTCRAEILQQILHQQVTVLTGETGSGKSTQLVQFLADSGIADSGSIICTQPRKLAAITLADRVKEESRGCYGDGSVISISSYSSGRHLDSKVIFMTDHCLLQYYMSDRKLSEVSCIIIDEAHERSLNTDLLIAMIKKLLCQRLDLRLIIMSATADADQLADYFFGCRTFHVTGRNFPVDICYVPCDTEGRSGSAIDGSYVSDVVKMAAEIHRMENEGGTILAFVTSQMDVEWACENFHLPSAIALPLHGKLTFEEQHKVFLNYPGKRKVIFATNVAETSLTIPGVKFVVDSGMVKESRFDPCTGINVLKVCRTSQSSAKQRAGRAGRTERGRCYRLYSEHDFELMPPHQEPEIRRVHLGIAVLRILALGIKNVQDFDYIDAPSPKAIEMATASLIQLGAVTPRGDVYELTSEGRYMVKLGIEPRLGKIILDCFSHRLGREGIVLAAVVANSSSIFCRVGTMENKLKSDCLKVQFCHHNGDLFTLLAVYKDWEDVAAERRNIWCWENSINAKSMRRCQDLVNELDKCLQNELNMIIPSYWRWNPLVQTDYDETLKGIILSAFSENVAMYSGYDHLGYEVALTGKHIQLHPSCSLLVFDQRPSWIVFGEILSASYQYLVCVTAFDSKAFSALSPPPLFDFRKMDSEKLQRRILTGFGSLILKRFCGKGGSNLNNFISRIRTDFLDDRIGVEVNVDENEVRVHASSKDMGKVCGAVNEFLEYELRLLQNECLEKCLFSGSVNASSSVALFGAGAEIRHLEVEQRGLTVDVFHPRMDCINDKELLMFLERSTSCAICAFHKFSFIGQSKVPEEWIRVMFLSPDAAKKATELNQVDFSGGLLTVNPSRNTYGGDAKLAPFSVLKAKVCWPRRVSKGVAIVKCQPEDVAAVAFDFSYLVIGEKYVHCERSTKFMDSLVLKGIDRETSEEEIFATLALMTSKELLDVFLLRGESVEDDPRACEEELLREISPFMPKKSPLAASVRVQVLQPEPKDTFMRATIMFDSSLHLEAAMALDHMNGKVLVGCLRWQKMKCQHLFHSSVSCPEPVYNVIHYQLDNLVASFRKRQGVECSIVQNENRTYRVNISATATKTVAELRRPLEALMKGTIVDHAALTPTVLQQLFSRDGVKFLKSIPRETGTYILFDKHALCVRIFGSSGQIEVAKQRLVESLVTLLESKQLQVNLRGGALPPDMMKRIVQKFGPELHGLKEMFPGADFSLDAKRHRIYISGGLKDLKPKVQEVISEVAQSSGSLVHDGSEESVCPICLCEVEDCYKLEHCRHEFCRSCLIEQCESAIKSQGSFPLRCSHNGCGFSILLADLRSLLPGDKFEELFRASISAFVTASVGRYRFCPSPDCPTVYEVSDSAAPYLCAACYVETCRCCHLEYHQLLSCEQYKEYKADPDLSLKAWSSGKENVKKCPCCPCTIEKVEGCNHIQCTCGKHVCWVCLEYFTTGEDCYEHLGAIHHGII